MSNLEQAKSLLNTFMESSDKVVLIKGNQHFMKHLLALHIIGLEEQQNTVLFRSNTISNAGEFLKTKSQAKYGHAYTFGHNAVFIDTNSLFSWKSTPLEVDYSIVYPLESVCKEENKELIIEDCIQRTKKKLFLVSCKDVEDYDWLSIYVDQSVVLDQKQNSLLF